MIGKDACGIKKRKVKNNFPFPISFLDENELIMNVFVVLLINKGESAQNKDEHYQLSLSIIFPIIPII